MRNPGRCRPQPSPPREAPLPRVVPDPPSADGRPDDRRCRQWSCPRSSRTLHFLDDGLVINADSPGLTDQWRCPPVSGQNPSQNLRGGDGVPLSDPVHAARSCQGAADEQRHEPTAAQKNCGESKNDGWKFMPSAPAMKVEGRITAEAIGWKFMPSAPAMKVEVRITAEAIRENLPVGGLAHPGVEGAQARNGVPCVGSYRSTARMIPPRSAGLSATRATHLRVGRLESGHHERLSIGGLVWAAGAGAH